MRSAPGRSAGPSLTRVANWLSDMFEQAWSHEMVVCQAHTPIYWHMTLILSGARCEKCVGIYALRTIGQLIHLSGQQPVLPCASSHSRDNVARGLPRAQARKDSPARVVAERARIACDRLPGTDNDRAEHAVGCADIAPGAGVDWVDVWMPGGWSADGAVI